MLLLPALLLASVLPPGDPAPSGDANVTRVYDLAAALPWRMNAEGSEALLPFLAHATEEEGYESSPMWGADALVELLRAVCGQEFEYEGRELRVDDHARLIVRAPVAVQERTERYLQFLEGIFGATTELAIDAIELPEGAASLPALVPVADVPKLLDAAAKRRSWRLTMRAGVTARLDLTRATSMVVDYNVEIAQGSAIADPIVEEMTAGTRILARAAPATGGLWLALILRRGDALGETREREMPVQLLAATQSRLDFVDAARTFQTPEVLNRSLALSTFVPEGKALAIQCGLEIAGKARGELLLVRRAGGALPIFQRVSLDPKGAAKEADLLFVNEQAAEPPSCQIGSLMVDAGPLPCGWMRGWGLDSGAYVDARFADESFDFLREQIRGGDEELRLQDFGPCLFVTSETWAPRRAPEAEPKAPRPEDRVEQMMRVAPSARIVQVAIALRRPGSALAAARWTLPVRTGGATAAVLGTETIIVWDYDVEVAQSAAVADPLMRVAFDGCAVWMTPSIGSSGEVSLDFSVRAHLRRGDARQLDLHAPMLGPLDQATYDQLFAREKLSFGKGETGPRKIVLGDVSGQGGLALEVEAFELK